MKFKNIISFLGPIGSYSHIATMKYIQYTNKTYFKKTHNNFKQIFYDVENYQSNYAIIPIENNTSGLIKQTYELLCYSKMHIIGEFNLPIKHCLIAKNNINITSINKVYSHPQPFDQCNYFLKKFPNWKLKYTNSTAEAVQKISTIKYDNVAAIGNKQSAKIYQLKIILKNISNKTNNYTRFIILSHNKQTIINQQYLKTILIIFINQISCSKILNIFKLHNINIIVKNININYNNQVQQTVYIETNTSIASDSMKHVIHYLYKKNILINFLSCYEKLCI